LPTLADGLLLLLFGRLNILLLLILLPFFLKMDTIVFDNNMN